MPAQMKPTQSKKMPWTMRLFLYGLILFVIYYLFKIIQILLNVQVIASLDLGRSALYQTISSMFWGTAGITLIIGISSKKAWARLSGLALGVLYSLVFWIESLLFTRSVLQTRWPVNLVLTILGLGILATILNLKSTRDYFGRNGVKIP